MLTLYYAVSSESNADREKSIWHPLMCMFQSVMEDLLNRSKWKEHAVPPHQTDLMLSDLISVKDDGGRERRMENQLSNLGLAFGTTIF